MESCGSGCVVERKEVLADVVEKVRLPVGPSARAATGLRGLRRREGGRRMGVSRIERLVEESVDAYAERNAP